MFTLEDLSRVAETVHRLCALPAIPSTGWCDLAAEAFVSRDPRDIVVVALAQRAARGLTILDPPNQVRLERERELWAWLDALPRELSSSGRIVAHAHHHPGPFLCVLAPIAGPKRAGSGGWVIIGAAYAQADQDAISREARLLTMLMPRLVDRCHIAFRDSDRPEPVHLTPTENRVLELLVLGRSVNGIAEELRRSPHTIHDHVKSLHRKLGASSRGELIARVMGIAHQPVRTM